MNAENEIFGFNHSGVGGLLLKRWSLPPALVNAVEFHHSPDESLTVSRTASIVHVADYLCRRIGIGNSGDTVVPQLNKKAFNLTHLTSGKIKQMSPEITKEFELATGFLFEGEDA